MNIEIKDAGSTGAGVEDHFAIVLDDFEIEDISGLDLCAPMTIAICSGCCSSS